MKIGFTGTREIDLPIAQRSALITMLDRWKGAKEFHHGDCKGADEFAAWAAYFRLIPIVVHPPSIHNERIFWPPSRSLRIEPTKPSLKRNHDIVEATDILIAMPKTRHEELSGTWATVRYARKLKKPICFIWPEGDVTIEDLD